MATRKVNGAAVKALREAVGLTQAELASRAETTAPTISHLEKGRDVSPALLVRIAHGLKVPVDAISADIEDAA
jgi:transcriptional regulator with XRE-family HTH domain